MNFEEHRPLVSALIVDQNLSQNTQPRPLQQKTNIAPPGVSRCATGSASRALFRARCSSDGASAAGCGLTYAAFSAPGGGPAWGQWSV